MAILKIEACSSCKTSAAHRVIGAAEAAKIVTLYGWHECTSSNTVLGGGFCCNLVEHTIIEDGCIYCGSSECVAYTHGESVCG